MSPDWAFAQKGSGVIVLFGDGRVVVLEFNGFLQRLASGEVAEADRILAPVFTDGQWRRVGDLRIFEMICTGGVRVDDLHCDFPGGVIAEGAEARRMLAVWEGAAETEIDTLLRAAAPPMAELLRAAAMPLATEPLHELPRPVVPPLPPPEK